MTELREKINNIVEDYNACKVLAESVNNPSVYEGTTATAEDIKLGKTAYSNGELIEGTMETKEDYNVAINTQVSAGGSSSSSINRSITRIAGNLTVSGTSTQYMFYECWSLETVPFIDLSTITNISYMFQSCKSLKTIPKFNTSNVTDAICTFSGCTNLEEIPQIDISKVTRSGMMFTNCTNLKTIPPLTIGASNMTNMFSGCPNLSDESLNNILLMCANSGVGNVTMKKLSYIGLTSKQATVCQGLSNYQAFLDAGWTTGY